MKSINPNEIPTAQLHQYLVSSVNPRPIALVSTIDGEGAPNLAPYSFFNVFSSNPPILVFSSNRKVKNNKTKDTLHNVRESREVVINVVSHEIVRQMTVASIEYPPDTSEFEKTGFTPLESEKVRPFRVAESPVQMECTVKDIIPLGDQGGAGHLVLCELEMMHISEKVLDDQGRISPYKIDLMGRLGRAFYVRVNGDAIERIYQPMNQLGLGYDALPSSIKDSQVLSANNIGQLASMPEWPTEEKIHSYRERLDIKEILSSESAFTTLHEKAKGLLNGLDAKDEAMVLLLLADEYIRR